MTNISDFAKLALLLAAFGGGYVVATIKADNERLAYSLEAQRQKAQVIEEAERQTAELSQNLIETQEALSRKNEETYNQFWAFSADVHDDRMHHTNAGNYQQVPNIAGSQFGADGCRCTPTNERDLKAAKLELLQVAKECDLKIHRCNSLMEMFEDWKTAFEIMIGKK